MEESLMHGLVDELYAALRSRRTVPPLTGQHPDIGLIETYNISLQV